MGEVFGFGFPSCSQTVRLMLTLCSSGFAARPHRKGHCRVYSSCWLTVAACRLTHHLFCLLYLLCPAGSCWFVPSGRYVLLSQCCPMESALTSGTKKAWSQAESSRPFHFHFTIPLCDPCHFSVRSGERVRCEVKNTSMWIFSNSDPKLEAQRQRLSSVVSADLLPSLEGVELGAYGKVSPHPVRCKVTRNTSGLIWNLFASSDRVVRSVPLSNQCFGEAEEQRRRTRELAARSPWQQSEDLHHCSSE